MSSASANSRSPRADRSTGSGKCRCCSELPRDLPSEIEEGFIAKLGTVIEESDESSFWLEYLVATDLLPLQSAKKLHSESVQLVAIFTTSQKTARANYLTERNRRRALWAGIEHENSASDTQRGGRDPFNHQLAINNQQFHRQLVSVASVSLAGAIRSSTNVFHSWQCGHCQSSSVLRYRQRTQMCGST